MATLGLRGAWLRVLSKTDSSREQRAMAQSTPLRERPRSQKVTARKTHRLAPVGVTVCCELR
jgi:hypothetical protein